MSRFDIVCAAPDTPEELKTKADYISDEADARPVLQRAIDEADRLGVSCVLLRGTYSINSHSERSPKGGICFYNPEPGRRYYCQNKSRYHVLEGAKMPLGWEDGSIITMGKEFYDSLPDDETFSLFYNDGGDSYGRGLAIKNLVVNLPGAYKPVIVFDGRFASAVRYEDCWVSSFQSLTADFITCEGIPVPHEKSVAFRGCHGANYYTSEWKNCAARGFGVGFDIGGEHIYCESLSALYNIYGFAFDCYRGKRFMSQPDDAPPQGIATYPTVCVNLLDEHNVHMPIFGNASHGNCPYEEKWGKHIEIIGMNLQWPTTAPGYGDYCSPDFTKGRNRSVEVSPGMVRGSISYVLDRVIEGCHCNMSLDPFFEEGHGKNFILRNLHEKLEK